MTWWWLSFCDPDRPKGERFLGVAIVPGITIVDACETAWDLGINPGGQVLGTELREPPIEKWRFQLLTKAEAELADQEREEH